jgi:hypothetical protein
MPELTPWLSDVHELLRTGLGTEAQKKPVWAVAQQMERIDAQTAIAVQAKASLKAAFRTWVSQFRYMEPEFPVDSHLRSSALEGPASIDPDTGKPATDAKRMAWREVRIKRCKEALAEGWTDEEVMAFVCARDEWREARLQ